MKEVRTLDREILSFVGFVVLLLSMFSVGWFALPNGSLFRALMPFYLIALVADTIAFIMLKHSRFKKVPETAS